MANEPSVVRGESAGGTAPPQIADAAITIIMPAYQEGTRIATTITALRTLPGLRRLLVVDDGSSDDTTVQAEKAGADVLCLPANRGKGAALRAGLASCPGEPTDILLLLDADLGATAGEAVHLLAPLIAGQADLTIARFPKPPGKAGFGLVKGLARMGTWLLTRRWLHAPISGQRAARRWVLDAAPFAEGYGLETAMNIAAGDAGARLEEVPVAMAHHASGRDVRGFLHRGRQFAHIAGALAAAAVGRTGERCAIRPHPVRALCWGTAVLLALSFFFTINSPRFTPHIHALLLLMVMLGLVAAPLLSGLLGARRKNYRGQTIPALGGLCWAPALLALCLWHRDLGVVQPHLRNHALGVVGFSFFLPGILLAWLGLGLLDDLRGSGTPKGVRGHLRALAQGRPTTGTIKLFAGGMLALLSAWLSVGASPLHLLAIPVAALLIALSANALNLFRPAPGPRVEGTGAQRHPVVAGRQRTSPAGNSPLLRGERRTLGVPGTDAGLAVAHRAALRPC